MPPAPERVWRAPRVAPLPLSARARRTARSAPGRAAVRVPERSSSRAARIDCGVCLKRLRWWSRRRRSGSGARRSKRRRRRRRRQRRRRRRRRRQRRMTRRRRWRQRRMTRRRR
eukprot:2388783-Prymnesium_polylepis.1